MSTTQRFQATGLTCGHCARAVSEELLALDGVLDAEVEVVNGGQSVVTVVAEGDRTRLDARTKIGGQMYDWGKSTRCLDRLIRDVRSFR